MNKDSRQKSEKRNLKAVLLFISVICLLLSVFCLPSPSGSAEITDVRGVRSWSVQEGMRVVIDLSGPASFTKGSLSNPERVFLDIQNARLPKKIKKEYRIGEGPLQAIRVSQFRTDAVRVVCDLASPLSGLKVFAMSEPDRSVIELPSGESPGKTDLKKQGREFRPEAPERESIRKRIVIDAGHGGHDPGAVGPGGLYEKDVVLDIALRVREMMEKDYPLYEVVLTRSQDVFIPLDERAAIANRGGADLFVSVHANASPNRKARGMETYLLNWTNDDEAIRVAARENAISLKKMRQVQDELGIILTSLERESKRDESVRLAGYIQKSLVSTIRPQYPRVNDLGVKQALFYVLVGAKMPSALVEVSFVSNPEEEKLLSDDGYRQELARSIVSGIDTYLSAVPHQRTASSGRANPLARTVSYTKR
ncbi:MAG: N-acetylmuramoyl-L-alanine amidase [Thermodesulfovibrionales bacterium]|jgi:N-acetylmuramoyl-L-alanine amidase